MHALMCTHKPNHVRGSGWAGARVGCSRRSQRSDQAKGWTVTDGRGGRSWQRRLDRVGDGSASRTQGMMTPPPHWIGRGGLRREGSACVAAPAPRPGAGSAQARWAGNAPQARTRESWSTPRLAPRFPCLLCTSPWLGAFLRNPFGREERACQAKPFTCMAVSGRAPDINPNLQVHSCRSLQAKRTMGEQDR